MYSCNNLNALHLQTLTDVLAHKMNIRNITKCTYFLAPNQLIGKYMYIIYYIVNSPKLFVGLTFMLKEEVYIGARRRSIRYCNAHIRTCILWFVAPFMESTRFSCAYSRCIQYRRGCIIHIPSLSSPTAAVVTIHVKPWSVCLCVGRRRYSNIIIWNIHLTINIYYLMDEISDQPWHYIHKTLHVELLFALLL